MFKLSQLVKNFVCASLICFLSVSAFADWIPLRIIVDAVHIGDLDVNLDAKGQALAVKGSDLTDMLRPYVQADKINRIQSLTESDDNLTLANLERIGISSVLLEKELKLTLIIPMDIRIVKDFPVFLARTKTGLLTYNKNYSGYLNVRGLFGYSDSSTPLVYTYQKMPAEGQFELVQNFNFFTFETTAHYKEFERKAFERVDTSVVHDFEEDQVRVRLGDFFTGVHGFQSAMSVGGLQIQKQFNIYPETGIINKRSTTIQIKNNSLLEVFVNNILVIRTRVSAGPYNLKELPLLYGRNKVKIVLSDDFGGKEEFDVDLLYDDQMLAKGAHDFTYQVGPPSYFVEHEKKYYLNNLSSFFHKYGVTDETTVFMNHQNYMASNLFGLGAGFLSTYGTNFVDVAYYTDETVKSAQAGRWYYNSPELNYTNFNRFRIFGRAEFKSSGFNSITPTTPLQPSFLEKYDFILQKQITEMSSFSVGLTKIIGQHSGVDDMNRRLAYQNKFAANWRADVTYDWSERQRDLDQIQLTLNWIEPEGKAQAAFTHDTVDNNTSVRVTKNNRSMYNDFQLNMFASRQKARSTSIESQKVDLSANYYATKYELRLQETSTSSGADFGTSGQAGFGSALAWTTDSMSFSRPITDSFAIVEAQGLGHKQYLTIPNGLEKDKILLENNENFVFSSLTSYMQRALRLDSTNLGISSHLEREAYILHPKYRAGLYIPLKVIKALLVRGRLTSDKPQQVKFAFGRILTEDGKVFSNNFFTDESGNFIIDGLSYGKYQIELADPRIQRIAFELVDSGESARAEEAGIAEDPEASEYELGTIKIEKEAGAR